MSGHGDSIPPGDAIRTASSRLAAAWKAPLPTKPADHTKKAQSGAAASKSQLNASSNTTKVAASAPRGRKKKAATVAAATVAATATTAAVDTTTAAATTATTAATTAAMTAVAATPTAATIAAVTRAAVDEPTCDWSRRAGSRVCFGVYGVEIFCTCSAENCDVTFHHDCLSAWEYDNK